MRESTQTFHLSSPAARLSVSLTVHDAELVRRVATGLRCSSGALVRAAVVQYLRRMGFEPGGQVYPNGRIPSQNPLSFGGTD